MIIIKGIIILAILAAIAYVLVHSVAWIVAALKLTKETKDPEAALDAVFNGSDVATWEGTLHGLSKPVVIKGAAARGYIPTGRTSTSSGVILIFTKVSAKV